MRVFYADHCEVVLPAGHRFPMGKYRALRERLLCEQILREEELIAAPLIPLENVRAVHSARYVEATWNGNLPALDQQRIGFPWSKALVRRSLASVGGTLAAARAALEDGLAGNLAGGTHHAHRDFGSGFCVFNDLAIAATTLLEERRIERVLIFDVDVHQGDGTAALFAEDPRVFTCSLHGEKNFPSRKQRSDLDVALADGIGDEAYLDELQRALEHCLATGPFDLVLIQGGVDALVNDRLGRLHLSLAGLAERDARMLERLRCAGLPVALTLGGGYAEPIESSLEAHLGTYRVAKRLERPFP